MQQGPRVGAFTVGKHCRYKQCNYKLQVLTFTCSWFFTKKPHLWLQRFAAFLCHSGLLVRPQRNFCLMRRELARFIDTGTDPHRQRRLTEQVGPRLRYVAVSTDTSQWSELYKAPSTKCYKLISYLRIHSRTDGFRKQRGNKNNVCNVLWRL